MRSSITMSICPLFLVRLFTGNLCSSTSLNFSQFIVRRGLCGGICFGIAWMSRVWIVMEEFSVY